MAKPRIAVTGEAGEAVLLRNQGCLLSRWSSTWIIGDLSLTARRLALSQSGKNRLELPLADITGLSVKRRKFILLFKEIIQITFALPGGTAEKKLWFIAPNLREWLGTLERLTNLHAEPAKAPDARPGRLPSRSSDSRWLIPGRNRNDEPLSLGEEQLRALSDAVGSSGACVLRHLWRTRHADIEELADLIGAGTHMEVLALIRNGINGKALQLFGAPVLRFAEQAFDEETGRRVCFQWWLQRTPEPLQQEGGEPLVEVHDEGKELFIVAAMRRASEKRPRMDVRASSLVLSGESAENPWEISVPLFCEVLAAPVGVTFINGMLGLRLAKKPGSEE